MVYTNVKMYADKKGISISLLEKKAGLQNGTIGKWRNSIPRSDSLKKVSDVLGVKVDNLLKGVLDAKN